MNRIIITVALLAACGCATKTRMVEVKGMYLNANTGCVAIGVGKVVAVPEGTESAAIKYEEDTAWLSPSTKTHTLNVLLTGTNSVIQADSIVRTICEAFTNATKSAEIMAKPVASTESSTN